VAPGHPGPGARGSPPQRAPNPSQPPTTPPRQVVCPLSGLYAATRSLLDVYGTLKTQGTTRDGMSQLAHFEVRARGPGPTRPRWPAARASPCARPARARLPLQEFNALIGLEDKIAAEERLVTRDGNMLVVKVRAPFKASNEVL
jgi:hypothetical protein